MSRVLALRPVVLLVLGLLVAPAGRAADPRLQLYDGSDGVTCRYFNAGAQIAWRHPLGDWRDAAGRARGAEPFAQATIDPGAAGRTVDWDVTRLVRGWVAGAYPNTGMLLAPANGKSSASAAFASRESPSADTRPRLTVRVTGAALPITLAPIADAWIDCSTAYALGTRPELRVGPGARSALQFDLAWLQGKHVAQANLRVTTVGAQRAPASVDLFRLDPPLPRTAAGGRGGIASAYPGDRGIARDVAVLLATGFESEDWRSAWSYVSATSHPDRIAQEPKRKFEPFLGHALRVEIPRGENLGLDMGFDFRDKLGYEPEEIYFRYYLRFADDWNPTADGGKLPGLAGTYGRVGWGGRRADAALGWSMRGQFGQAPSAANPLRDRITIGTYAYHAAMEDRFGDHWNWMDGELGLLERNRWYCLEQYFKVNTPGATDGVLRAWVDGALAFEKVGIYVRDLPSIKIEKVWMDVYHGGTVPAASPLVLYVDNVVVARKPIGCVSR